MSTFYIPIFMYHTESWPWTKAEVIRLKETRDVILKSHESKNKKRI